jgi:glycosyltransferase involved in cell wall biosynthesis
MLWASVIIPTCNRPILLARCLRRLAPQAQTRVPGGYEVIVSDDGRWNEEARRVMQRFPWVRWLRGPRRGPAANRNRGAHAARGTWLIFTDDDCLPEPRWLAAFAEATAQPGAAGAFEGAVLPVVPFQRTGLRCPANATGGLFWSANVAIRRDLFQSVGGFCPLFPYAAEEDRDLYLRLQPVTSIPFIRAACVRHVVAQLTVPQLLSRIRPAAYSHTLLCLRHPHQLRIHGLRERMLADVLRETRLLWRAARIADWRAIAASGASLTWGVACGAWYSATLRASIPAVANGLEPRALLAHGAPGGSLTEHDRPI